MLLCLLALNLPFAASAGRSCEEWHAELVSVEGRVEIRTSGGWAPLSSGDRVCTGDSIRVKSYGRAALRLPDKTVLRLDQDTSVTFAEPEDETGSWLDLLKGVIHVISRDPRALRFNTPYANAGLEGTEFVIAVADGETDVTVLEGEVRLSNEAGSVGVPSGQRGSARLATAPETEPIPDPIQVIAWTPYYVPVLDGELPSADQEPASAEVGDPGFYAGRGARRLSVGRVDEARADLRHALTLDTGHGPALALLALASLTEKDLDDARMRAEAAVASPDPGAAAWLALSYVREAESALAAALDAAATAAAVAPGHAFAFARLAELELAAGHHSAATETAQRAVRLQPDLSHAHTVLGFAQLSGRSSAEAAETFRKAIRLEPAAPLPRLGLGLALARQGELTAAREQVEIAVVLDPTNALSRSYMAKVYDTERREALSASQLQLAKALGARDPTAWLYDALRKQAENRPVEALHDLQKAISL
ncbi:MAG: FecR domain-containing protein, partial [Gammaproteobacteria bacterium]|nr:FecR domain-containing protein [Gammaproteobacteria bacterium]